MTMIEVCWHFAENGKRIVDSIDGDPDHPDKTYWQNRMDNDPVPTHFIAEVTHD